MSKTIKHAILSASASHRWLTCPGSIRMSVGMPRSSSSYAMEGTAAHKLADQKLRDGGDALEALGDVIQVEGAAFPVTEEMAVAVQVYLDLVRKEMKLAGKGAELMVENKFKLDWLYPGLYGTNDAMICQPFGKATIIDFKFGSGVAVEVKDNPQLLYYGLGGTYKGGYEEVEIVVCQPRAIHRDGPVRRQLLTIDELTAWGKDVLLPGAIAAEKPDAPLTISSECWFCPALAVCPEQKAKAYAVAKSVFAEVPVSPVAPEAMTYEEMKKVLDVADMLESWLKSVRSHARILLEQGKASSGELGYKLVTGRATRSWKSEEEAKAWLESIVGNEAYITKLVSVAQAEKVLKGDGKKALEEMVEVVRGVQMVPVSDKREEITGNLMMLEAVEGL